MSKTHNAIFSWGGLVALISLCLSKIVWISERWDALAKMPIMGQIAKSIWEYLSMTNVQNLLMGFAVLCIILSVGYEYLKKGRFTVLDVSFDDATDPSVTYKRKLRVVLKSNSISDVELLEPIWIPAMNGVSIQSPFSYRFRREGPRGRESNNWEAETTTLTASRDQIFDLWIGFCQSFSVGELKVAHQSNSVGTLVLPIKAGKRQKNIKIRL
jgi:hypothetical protein